MKTHENTEKPLSTEKHRKTQKNKEKKHMKTHENT